MAEKDKHLSGEAPDIENGAAETEEQAEDTKTEDVVTESAPMAESEEEEDPEALLISRLSELEDAHLRLRAEYDNYRKRTLKEKSDLLKYAAEKVVIDFLEVLDDFDRALESLPSEDEGNAETRRGIELIRDKMIAKLRGQGVKEMSVIGEPFDADAHEAIAMVPAPDPDKKGKVIDCVQKGYTLSDKVIRHPKVVVGQ